MIVNSSKRIIQGLRNFPWAFALQTNVENDLAAYDPFQVCSKLCFTSASFNRF